MADVSQRDFPLVERRRLEFIDPPFMGGGRVMTDAGELAQIVNGSEIRFLAFLEFRSGTEPRGQHFHRTKVECFYVIRGSVRALYLDMSAGKRHTLDLEAGDLVTVHPGCAHAYAAMAPSDALEFSQQPYDPADVFPVAMEHLGALGHMPRP